MEKLQQVVQRSKIIHESGYTKRQIFSIDKTAFSWKMMPPRAFIAREEKSLLGFKGQADLLGANDAAGASKLKSLLIYSFGNLRSLKNYAKSTLPLLYKRNNKARMTAHLFITWFTESFNPIVENYCPENKKKIL